MTALGADSVPGSDGRDDQHLVPDPEELRLALRSPELPLPAALTALEAAQRVSDLIRAERPREAVAVASHGTRLPGTDRDRAQLAEARLSAVLVPREVPAVERGHVPRLRALPEPVDPAPAAGEWVAAIDRAGAPLLAEAVAAVLLERGILTPPPAGPGPRGGRRRAAPRELPADLLAVVRLLDLPAAPAVEPLVRSRALRETLAAADRLEAAQDPELPTLLEDPRPLLQVRLAQALEEAGRREAAVTPALDALEALEHQAVEQGEHPDPRRLAVAAHAVLARALAATRPLVAVDHALQALDALEGVDDPPLRVGLATDLLNALVAADLTDHAAYAADRLLSLQRSLRQDGQRLAPLLAVATQRVRTGRDRAAREVLEEVAPLARAQRDRRASMEAARLAAVMADRAGDGPATLRHLRRTAADARWLADDLATPSTARGPLLRAELEAHALILRRALDLGEFAHARAAARAVERRTRPDGGRLLLPAALLWDHRVDARVGEVIAHGEDLGRRHRDGQGLPDRAEQEAAELLAAAEEAIALAPGGHRERARYWEAYLIERHAALLAGRGRHAAALSAARRAHDAWQRQDADPEDLERSAALVEDLSRYRSGGRRRA
ncbi:hypothetical protein [Brachybacterium squillarum]|uniref:hypothetical protein n=1 Tax=Brachybacterium squillarum TaxID=661979 RepID=UPI000262976E|nr:hypothetical protein [Brachybacterium squillarum]